MRAQTTFYNAISSIWGHGVCLGFKQFPSEWGRAHQHFREGAHLRVFSYHKNKSHEAQFVRDPHTLNCNNSTNECGQSSQADKNKEVPFVLLQDE